MLNKTEKLAASLRNPLREKLAGFFKGKPLPEEIALADKLGTALIGAGCNQHNISVRTKLLGKGQLVKYATRYAQWDTELHKQADRRLMLKAVVALTNESTPFALRVKKKELIVGTFESSWMNIYKDKKYFAKSEFDKFKEAVEHATKTD